jgi:glycosyltransferase involved in cell wall biosynthesis
MTADHPGPLVSVIVPTYGRPAMLERALSSILRQSYRQFEIVVVNDGGVDVAENIRRLDHEGRIKYVRHGSNLGLAAARNTGIGQARGKYVAYLDDDDVFYPDHLMTLVEYLEGHPAFMVAYADAAYVTQQRREHDYVETGREVRYSVDFDRERLLTQNYIPAPCILHRRDCLQQVGQFDPDLPRYEDWDLWIRMSRRFVFSHVKKVTCEVSWRVDHSTMTSQGVGPFGFSYLSMIYKYREFLKGETLGKVNASVSNQLGILRDGLEEQLLFGEPALVKLFGIEDFRHLVSRFLFLKKQYGREHEQGFLAILALLYTYGRGRPSYLRTVAGLGVAETVQAGPPSPRPTGKEQAAHLLSGQSAKDEQSAPHRSPELVGMQRKRTGELALPPRRPCLALVLPGDGRAWRAVRDLMCVPLTRLRLHIDARLVDTSGLFDRRWYLEHNPDVAQARDDPVLHYLRHGGFDARDPSPRFRTAWYLETYPDVKAAGMNPLVHFLKYGRQEGRAIREAPRVTVVIPTFNGGAMIGRAVQSVLLQECTDYEIVIVDDGSTDSTVELVRKLTPSARVLQQPNRGTMSARQAGIEAAHGRLIALLDQDDLWFKDHLGEAVHFLDEHPETGLVLANMQAVDDDGNPLGFNVVAEAKCYTPSWQDLLLLHPINNSTSVFRKEVVARIGGLDPRFGTSGALGDSDTFARMARITGIHFLNQIHGAYRWSDLRPGRMSGFLDNLQTYATKHWKDQGLLDQNDVELRAKFAQTCCKYAWNILRLLAKQHKGRIPREVLLEANESARTLRDLFGELGGSMAGLRPLDPAMLASTDEALDTALFQYMLREDLRAAFPHVLDGDLNELRKMSEQLPGLG